MNYPIIAARTTSKLGEEANAMNVNSVLSNDTPNPVTFQRVAPRSNPTKLHIAAIGTK